MTLLGREGFLQAVAPAALIRKRDGVGSDSRPRDRLISGYSEDTLLAHLDGGPRATGTLGSDFEVYPLLKKLGAPFADMITIGRTSNNDVVLKDVTVSRFHAYFRERESAWVVADAGSKNGTHLRGSELVARKEEDVQSGDSVRIGDIVTTFYTANDLFEVLSSAG
ncbi:FHA domain-containing protein [Haliangium ochraceum]|uniref:FHA domain-containing protein n=1 Tax=Haliangium ochraceum TaxID=80816 RepID=UPI001E5C8218|nr:FHA domain-containing protein [Haliangium ochraceum]